MTPRIVTIHLAGIAENLKREIRMDVRTFRNWALKRAAGVPNMTPYGFCHYPGTRAGEAYLGTGRRSYAEQAFIRSVYGIIVHQQAIHEVRRDGRHSDLIRLCAEKELLDMIDIGRRSGYDQARAELVAKHPDIAPAEIVLPKLIAA